MILVLMLQSIAKRTLVNSTCNIDDIVYYEITTLDSLHKDHHSIRYHHHREYFAKVFKVKNYLI